MLKIGFDAKRLFFNDFGLGQYSRTLVRHLRELYPDNEYHLFTPGTRVTADTRFFADPSKFKIHTPNGPFTSWWRYTGMIKAIRRSGVDVFHGLSHELPFGIRKTNAATVVTMHDVYYKKFPSEFSIGDRWIYEMKYRHALRNADHVIAASHATARDLNDLFNTIPQNTSIVYQACDDIFYQSAQKHPQKIPYILFVGSIIPRKNLMLIPRAFKLLRETNPYRCIVVGSGKSYEKKVRQYIHAQDLDDRFIFYKNLNQKDLAELYAQASALVSPSFCEGFGRPVLEAMVAKRPVIISAKTSMEEIAGNCGIIIDPHDPESLADALKGLDEMTEKHKDCFTSRIQKFEKHILSEFLMKIYIDCAKK